MSSFSQDSFSRCRLLLFPWLVLICMIGILGWSLSLIHRLEWLITISQILYLGLVVHYFILLKRKEKDIRDDLIKPLKYLPFLLISSFIIIAGSIYNPNQLDALSYRLPRIYMWLQEGGIYFIPTADQRMNYMPVFWELNSLPFFGLFGDRGFWILNFLAWVSLWLILSDFADYCVEEVSYRSRIAIIFLLSAFAVLQAPSTMNDLLATTLLLLSAAFIVRFEAQKNRWDIVCSGLAFAACTGTKPHFILLGLPWVLWFILSRAKPWKVFPWRVLPLLVPVIFLVSAIPTLVSNQIHFGSVKGELTGDTLNYGSIFNNNIIGTFSFLWGAVQPPLNPLAGMWNSFSEKFLDLGGLLGSSRHFFPQVREVITVDAASFGFILFCAFFTGIYLSFKKNFHGKNIFTYSILAAAFSFIVAIFNVVPGTISRSFFGLGALAFPLAMAGLSNLQTRIQKIFLWLSVVTAIILVVLTPAHPLWPVTTISNLFRKNHLEKISKLLEGRYLIFTDRYNVGEDLLKKLPRNKIRMSIAASSDHALLQLWKPIRQYRDIHFIQKDSSLAQILEFSTDYLIIMKTPDTHVFDALDAEVSLSPSFELIEEQNFQSKASRGIDVWKLYQRK